MFTAGPFSMVVGPWGQSQKFHMEVKSFENNQFDQYEKNGWSSWNTTMNFSTTLLGDMLIPREKTYDTQVFQIGPLLMVSKCEVQTLPSSLAPFLLFVFLFGETELWVEHQGKICTPPKTNMTVKNPPWMKMYFLLNMGIFRGVNARVRPMKIRFHLRVWFKLCAKKGYLLGT